jgi:AcrR family transcriptional regulator
MSSVSILDPADAPGKQAVLQAALALFTDQGIDATSVREIGRRAGLTNPALFRHFKTKEDVALELFGRIHARLWPILPPVEGHPFAGALRATIAAYLDFFDADLVAALFFQENLRRLWARLPKAARKRSLLGHLHQLLEAGVAQRALPGGVDDDLRVALVAGFLGQFARQLYFGAVRGPAAACLDEINRLLLQGLDGRSAR